MKEIKLYKKICILLIPILFWILFFLLEYASCYIENDVLDKFFTYIPLFRYFSCIIIIPTTYAFLNWMLAKNIKEALLFYIISYIAQVLGFFLEGFSYYNFISGDNVTYVLAFGVTELLAIILGIVYLFAIIFYIIAYLIDKIPER